jgi:hypothetical protein
VTKTQALYVLGLMIVLLWFTAGAMARDICMAPIANAMKRNGYDTSDNSLKKVHYALICMGVITWIFIFGAIIYFIGKGVYWFFSTGTHKRVATNVWNELKDMNPFKYKRPDVFDEPAVTFGPDHNPDDPNCNCMRCH